jgi:hypothetical protein
MIGRCASQNILQGFCLRNALTLTFCLSALILSGCPPENARHAEVEPNADAGMSAIGREGEQAPDQGVNEELQAGEDGSRENGAEEEDGARIRECNERCAAAGNEDDACRERCAGLDGSEEEPMAPSDCEARCAERARAVHDECIEGGGEVRPCRERAGIARDDCVQNICGDAGNEPMAPGDCEAGCMDRARTVYDECMEGGGEAGRCRERAGMALNDCRERVCGDTGNEPMAPGDCEAGCAERARAVYNQCIEGGGEEGGCRERAGMAHDDCLERVCGDAGNEPMAPGDCEAGCAERARAVYEQ